MNKYVIGLDLGINNVGWSVVDAENNSILKSGVRLFSVANTAVDRRNFRSVKRRKKRRHNRVRDILSLFSSIGFTNTNTCDSELLEKRVLGLNKKISEQDIVNICCFIATHRGYIPFGDEERNLVDLGDLYPCEYLSQLKINTGRYRALEDVVIDNKDLIKEVEKILDTQVTFYPSLKNISKILIEIINRKRKFYEGPGSENSRTDYGRFKTEEYKNRTGKTEDLEYLYDDLSSKCSICVGEKAAPMGNYYYEVFNLLNDFINTSIVKTDNLIDQSAVELDNKSGYYKLTSESLEKIITYCKETKNIKYDKLYKELFGLKKEDLTGYRVEKDYKPLFSTMNYYRSIRDAFEGFPNEWLKDVEQYNELIRILTVSPGIVETKNMLEKSLVINKEFSEEELEILKNVANKLKSKTAFSYGSLSEKALKRAISDMLSTRMNFMQVSREFNYDEEMTKDFIDRYKETDGILLMDDQFVDEIIASPQVKKSLRQSIKVINSIILENGCYPEVIAVESTHEMNGSKKRNQIEREQKKNEELRNEAEQFLIREFGNEYVSEKNIMKVMLFNELDGRCPYCNESLNGINQIINGGLEVEHILPLSKSYNDSYNNKTLSCVECNQKKINNTPYMWMGPERFEEFSDRIKKMKFSDEKKLNFLETKDLDKYNTRFFNRNLRDTAYATSELINQINIFNKYLDNKLKDFNKIKTLSTPGQITSKIRDNIGLDKNRDIGRFHHAVDASIVASIALDDKLGKILIESQNDSSFWKRKKYLGERIDYMMLNFKESVLDGELRKIKSDDDIKISDQVIKDPNKSIANANVYKYLKLDGEYYKVDQISDIYSENIKDELLKKLFDDCNTGFNLMIKDNNKKMYEKLKSIYFEYKDRGSSTNPFVNYCLEVNDITKEKFNYIEHGIKQENGPVIKKLRYYTNVNDPNLLEKSNLKMKSNTYIGLDSVGQAYTKVYWDNDVKKFIFLPIYTTSVDLNTHKLNKKDKTYQLFYDKYLRGKNYTFVADLYNGNYIEVEKKDGIIKGFISGYDKDGNRITLKKKNNNQKSPDRFSASDKSLKVYDVDYLGNKKIRLTWPSK